MSALPNRLNMLRVGQRSNFGLLMLLSPCLLNELERNFTSYEVKQIANLQSRYAMRLYEF